MQATQDQQLHFAIATEQHRQMAEYTEKIKTYLIDVLGYSVDDLEGMTRFELYDLVTDIKEMNAYINGKEK